MSRGPGGRQERHHAGTGPERQREQRRTPTSGLVGAVLGASAVGYVAVVLGSSLIGLTVLFPGDLLSGFPPWSARPAGPAAEVVNQYLWDPLDNVIPSRQEIRTRILAGDWPGWQPWTMGGSGLASVPSYGVLTPAFLPYLLLPVDLALGYAKLLEFATAATGTALFLRRLGTSWAPAWLAGAIYATTGFLTAWTLWPHAAVAATLPWLFWAVERHLQVRTLASLAPVSLVVGVLLFGGFPAVAGWGLYAAGAYSLLRVLLPTPAPRAGGPVPVGPSPPEDAEPAASVTRRARTLDALATLGGLGVAVALGVALAAWQLLPFVEQYGRLDTSYRASFAGEALPLRFLVTAVFPNVWGTAGPFFPTTNPVESETFVGAGAVVLASVALVLRPRAPRGVRTFFLVLAAVCLLLVFTRLPGLAWVESLPVFAGNPIGRLRSVVGLAVAVLAGFGLDALMRRRGDTRARADETRAAGRGRALGAAAVAGVAAAAVLAAAAVVRPMATTELPAGYVDTRLAVGVVAALATAAVVAAAVRPGSWRRPLLASLPLIVAVPAAVSASTMWPQVPRAQFYPVTDAHRFLSGALGSDRFDAVSTTMLPGSALYYRLRSTGGHVFAAQEYKELYRAATGYVAPNYATLPTTDAALLSSPGLDRFGTRYVVARLGDPVPGERVRSAEPVGEVPLVPGVPVAVPLPPGGLRGLTLDVAGDLPAPGVDGVLEVQLVDVRGDVVASGSTRRPVPGPAAFPVDEPTLLVEQRELNVALAGDRQPLPAPLSAVLTWRGTQDLPVLAGADGTPAVQVVQPAADGLQLVAVGDAAIYERLDALPRIRWASRADVETDPGRRLERLVGGDVGRDTVLLSAQGPPASGRPAGLRVLEDSGDTVRVAVEAGGAGYLVVADGLQHDWRASVDGEPAVLHGADHAFGAVHVPPGAHEVELSYAPAGATLGAGVSAAAAAAIGLVMLTGRRRRIAAGPRSAAPPR